MSPMTKAIMREIHSDDNVCEVCQPNKCPHSSKIFTSFCGRGADNKHLGKPKHTTTHTTYTNLDPFFVNYYFIYVNHVDYNASPSINSPQLQA